MENKIQPFILLMPHLTDELHHSGRSLHLRRKPHLSQEMQARQQSSDSKPAKWGTVEPVCQCSAGLKLSMEIPDRGRNFRQHLVRGAAGVDIRRKSIRLRRTAGEVRTSRLDPRGVRSDRRIDTVSKTKEIARHLRVKSPTAASERPWRSINVVLNRFMQPLQFFVLQGRREIAEHTIAFT